MPGMLDDLLALLDKPLVLLIVLMIGGMIGLALANVLDRLDREKRRAYWRGRNATTKPGTWPRVTEDRSSKRDVDLATTQLTSVMNASFRARPLLNKSEAQVFAALDRIVIARNAQWQVMAQVSLGEFLASDDKEAYLAINSKRVDFALMDASALVRHALEYQGSGHHQGTAAARDAIKKEALRKAGIGYHEIIAGHTTPSELKRLVERLVPPAQGGQAL
jgi:Protein of unknown function (DUF2726)